MFDVMIGIGLILVILAVAPVLFTAAVTGLAILDKQGQNKRNSKYNNRNDD